MARALATHPLGRPAHARQRHGGPLGLPWTVATGTSGASSFGHDCGDREQGRGSEDYEHDHASSIIVRGISQKRRSRGMPGHRGTDQIPYAPGLPGYTRRVSEPNGQLRAARERLPSRRVPGGPMSRAELAETVNAWLWDTAGQRFDLDARAVARWERGVVRWPGAHYRSALRHVLGAATDTELGLRPASRAVMTPSPPTGPPATPSPPPWAIAATLTRSSLDAAALDHLEQAAYGYAKRYPQTAPAELWPAVSALITHVNGALTQPMPLSLRQRASALMGLLTGLAGSLWTDFNKPVDAARYFDVAELAAREADTPDLTSWVLATRSITSFYAGDYGAAHAFLVRAEQQAAIQPSRRRQAWIAALSARTAAALGDFDCAHRALDAAHRHVDRVSEPGTGTDFFDAARLNGLAGSTYLAMRDTTRAAPVLREALARRAAHDSKGRALLGLDLATCHVHDGETEEASRVAITALDWARDAMVEPIIVRARELRRDLVRLSGPAGLQNLDACLREVVRA